MTVQAPPIYHPPADRTLLDPPRARHGPDPLSLRGLTKRWRRDGPPVLDGVSLTLGPGTRTWVGGRNGVGKTTLLRIAAGLIDPDRGNVDARGADVHADRARYQRLVAFLAAGDRGLYARLPVRHHLEFVARISLVPQSAVGGRVEQAIEDFDLVALADRRADRISMGQRQRLRIALTFLPRPEVVLLDEPLTSLDEAGGRMLDEAISEIVLRGGAVLWCSPSAEQRDAPFDARFVLEDGRLRRE